MTRWHFVIQSILVSGTWIWMEGSIKKFIEDNAVSEGFLQEWYQASVDETQNPVWTDMHITEVFGDFYLTPKESVEKLWQIGFEI